MFVVVSVWSLLCVLSVLLCDVYVVVFYVFVFVVVICCLCCLCVVVVCLCLLLCVGFCVVSCLLMRSVSRVLFVVVCSLL